MTKITPKNLRAETVLNLIGHTPLMPLRFEPEGLTILAKCEFVNPSGSVKDRLAKHVLLDAESRGAIRPGSVILECTSGNTGISLSMVGAAMGYPVVILMSSSASEERRRLIRQLGGKVLLYDKAATYQAGIDISKRMAAENPLYFLPRQFENPINITEHELTTGQEILRQVHGRIDVFVHGYGTGGTLAGCAKAIKAVWPKAKIVAMEPGDETLMGGECPCCHRIEGIANGYAPPLLQNAPIDDRIKVTGAEAMAMTRRLHREFGLLVGTSSGANVTAALRAAAEAGPKATVVTLLCDRAERYFSTSLFDCPGAEEMLA